MAISCSSSSDTRCCSASHSLRVISSSCCNLSNSAFRSRKNSSSPPLIVALLKPYLISEPWSWTTCEQKTIHQITTFRLPSNLSTKLTAPSTWSESDLFPDSFLPDTGRRGARSAAFLSPLASLNCLFSCNKRSFLRRSMTMIWFSSSICFVSSSHRVSRFSIVLHSLKIWPSGRS